MKTTSTISTSTALSRLPRFFFAVVLLAGSLLTGCDALDPNTGDQAYQPDTRLAQTSQKARDASFETVSDLIGTWKYDAGAGKVRFKANGVVRVTNNCPASYKGRYETDAATAKLLIIDLRHESGCVEFDGNALVEALRAAIRYAVEGDNLTISFQAGEEVQALQFTRAGSSTDGGSYDGVDGDTGSDDGGSYDDVPGDEPGDEHEPKEDA